MSAAEQGAGGGRASATRNVLYEAAAALFVERGYEDTTMADIAERAGTSRRTAFNHFPAKGDIPMLWTRRMADVAVDVIAGSAGDPAAERIRAYFRLISELVEAEPELTRQMMLGWTAATGPIRYESQLLADLTPLLRDGQARGEISSTVDVAEAARTLSDTYMGVIFRWVRAQDGTAEHDAGQHAVPHGGIELILTAIRARD